MKAADQVFLAGQKQLPVTDENAQSSSLLAMMGTLLLALTGLIGEIIRKKHNEK